MSYTVGKATAMEFARLVHNKLRENPLHDELCNGRTVKFEGALKKVAGTTGLYEGLSVQVSVELDETIISHSVHLSVHLITMGYAQEIDQPLSHFLSDVIRYVKSREEQSHM